MFASVVKQHSFPTVSAMGFIAASPTNNILRTLDSGFPKLKKILLVLSIKKFTHFVHVLRVRREVLNWYTFSG